MGRRDEQHGGEGADPAAAPVHHQAEGGGAARQHPLHAFRAARHGPVRVDQAQKVVEGSVHRERGEEDHVASGAGSGLRAQTGVLPPRSEARKHTDIELLVSQNIRLWVGAGDPQQSAVHRVHFHAVVPRAGVRAAVAGVQLPGGHLRAGVHHGGTVPAEAALPGAERARPDEQDLLGARHACRQGLERRRTTGRTEGLPDSPLRQTGTQEGHSQCRQGSRRTHGVDAAVQPQEETDERTDHPT